MRQARHRLAGAALRNGIGMRMLPESAPRPAAPLLCMESATHHAVWLVQVHYEARSMGLWQRQSSFSFNAGQVRAQAHTP